jgi:hypothetical protein
MFQACQRGMPSWAAVSRVTGPDSSFSFLLEQSLHFRWMTGAKLNELQDHP